MTFLFKDRKDAGQKLADLLLSYKDKKNCTVLALPRGGVIVAYEIAKILKLPLDIVVPRKIGAPFNEELAIGAISGDARFFDEALIAEFNVSQEYLKRTIAFEKKEMERRKTLYRQGRPPLKVAGQEILLIDDGVATGATMKAAIKDLKQQGAAKIIVAIPVGPPSTVFELKEMVFDVFTLFTPTNFMAIGQFYESFEQTCDEEVINALKLVV